MSHPLQILALLMLVSTSAPAAAPDLRSDDAALIAHIKRTDFIFTTALGACSGEKIVRSGSGTSARFKYTAYCAARAADASDCPGYKLTAQGTVDTPSEATVRSLKADLECSG